MNQVIGIDFGQLSAVINILFLLLIASYLFNKRIEKAGNRTEGWDWLLVVIGTTYTQIAIGVLDLVLDWNAFFIAMLAYCVSGFPMAYGAYLRHRERRGRAEQALRE